MASRGVAGQGGRVASVLSGRSRVSADSRTDQRGVLAAVAASADVAAARAVGPARACPAAAPAADVPRQPLANSSLFRSVRCSPAAGAGRGGSTGRVASVGDSRRPSRCVGAARFDRGRSAAAVGGTHWAALGQPMATRHEGGGCVREDDDGHRRARARRVQGTTAREPRSQHARGGHLVGACTRPRTAEDGPWRRSCRQRGWSAGLAS